jgi:fibronectin-binding autotransporter adhesin
MRNLSNLPPKPLCLLVLMVATFSGAELIAATKTWDGSSSGNWATGANWSGGTAPNSGDDLVFPTGVAQLLTTNNFSPNRAFQSITMLAPNYLIRGSTVILTNGIRCGHSTAAVAVDTDVELRGDQSFFVTNAAASLLLRATSLNLNANTLTVSGSGRVDIYEAISGKGGVTKSGAGTLNYYGAAANTYLGDTTVNQGILALHKTNVVAVPSTLFVGDGTGGSDADIVRLYDSDQIANSAAVIVSSSGWLDCGTLPPGQDDTIGSLAINNGGHVSGPDGSTLTVAGSMTCNGNATSVIDGSGYLYLTAATPTINVTGSGTGVNLAISIPIGVSSLAKSGTGWLRIYSPLVGSPDININQGTLEAQSSSALGSFPNGVSVATGATLFLSGGSFTGHSLTLSGAGFGGTSGAWRVSQIASNIVWSGSVTLASDSVINVLDSFSGSTHLTITGAVNGVGRLIKNGGGSLHLTGASPNTYSGGTTIIDGYLDLVKTPGVTAVPGNVIVGTGIGGTSPDLHLTAANQIADGFDVTITNGMFDLNAFPETIGTLNGNGTVTLGPGSTLTVSPNAVTCTFDGLINDSGNLAKSGTGKLILTHTNTFTGSTTITNGTLQVDGSNLRSAVLILDSARLQGNGVVGNIELFGSSATVAAGASPGVLTCSNLIFTYKGHLAAELNGEQPGSGYDQVKVRGTVSFAANAFLDASVGFSSWLSNQFVIINNDGADAIAGTFSGRPEGSTLTLGAEQFRISYVGGDGNDVVLTQLTGAPRPPELTIQSLPPDKVRLLWPTNNSDGFSLQSNTNLATTNWIAAGPSPVVTGTNRVVTNQASGARKLYRLRKP